MEWTERALARMKQIEAGWSPSTAADVRARAEQVAAVWGHPAVRRWDVEEALIVYLDEHLRRHGLA